MQIELLLALVRVAGIVVLLIVKDEVEVGLAAEVEH